MTITPLRQEQPAPTSVNTEKAADADPSLKDANVQISALALLSFEEHVRKVPREAELLIHYANDTRRFLGFRQSFVLKRIVRGAPLQVAAASSIAVIDRDAPMIRWIEKLVSRLAADAGDHAQQYFTLPAYCDETDEEVASYPFAEFLWTPWRDGDDIVGGLLIARETPWAENDAATAERFANLYAHASRALNGARRGLRARLATRKRLGALAAALLIIGAWPVSITALAPAEVTPLEPFIVAAPFDGVVKEILVDQNQRVAAGAPIIAFEDIERRNAFDIAAEEEAVALARFQRESQGAINDPRAKREIAIAKAELELTRAEKAYAGDLLAKTFLNAERDGIAIYTDKRDWIGRPVAAGEAIMQLADPAQIRFAIDLPVKESLVLKEGARIKVFLDSDPLNPIEATLTEASYQARIDKRSIISYQVSATLKDPNTSPPRIGVQGTAQIHGEKAPLAYAMLRRPLSYLRQLTGW